MSGPVEPGVMSRPVPEAAPIVGVVLAFGFALFGFLFSSDHLVTVLVSVVLLYPFIGFGILRSETPESAFRPDAVLAVGFLGGAVVLLFGIATGRAPFGALVATVIAVPPGLYHARFGEGVNPVDPAVSLAVGLLAAGGLLLYGIVADRPLLGALPAVLLGVAAVDYQRQRGDPLERRVRTVAVLGSLGGGLTAFAALAMAGRPTAGLAAGAVLVAIGAALALDVRR